MRRQYMTSAWRRKAEEAFFAAGGFNGGFTVDAAGRVLSRLYSLGVPAVSAGRMLAKNRLGIAGLEMMRAMLDGADCKNEIKRLAAQVAGEEG